MPCKKPKSTNALMKYMRDEKHIDISGSYQKRELMNIGYYHGYKGYRYINRPSDHIDFNNFNELITIYNFDAELKSLFYSKVMFIETALKNYVLEALIEECNSDNFNDIYNLALDNYKSFSSVSSPEKLKRALNKRLDLRSRIYKIQADSYNKNNKIVTHYLSKDTPIPIWGIFELLSLGEFGHLVSCINLNCRKNISRKLGIRQSDDNNYMLTERMIYVIKDLRNAIAHNDVIFDTRFRTSNINSRLINALKNETNIKDIDFSTITDYLILIVYQMKLLKCTKTEIKKLISDYTFLTEKLRSGIPTTIYNKIIKSNNRLKIIKLKEYASKNF